MKIFFAGVPAGDGALVYREKEIYKFLWNRLTSYFYILINKDMWEATKESINENHRNFQ